jgi:hypothetical protein
MKARSFPLTEETLHRVREGDRRAIPVSAAKALQEELRSLKIVDPAVGSGSLLVACLEVLLEIATGCKRVCGGDLVKGSDDWAQAARGFVQACLYGVDISPEAIEVARLRFWLFLAVGEQTAAALPDLGFNLRVGNSLAPHDQEERLSCELARRDLATRNLELDEILEALNRLRDARINFSKAADSAAARKAAFLRLEAAERELNKALGWKPTGPDDAPAFVWSVHFSEVFQSPNRGFDVVIANPPYVRTSGLSQSDGELKQRYRSMKNKNVDLYYGFIERSILPPLATDGAEAAGGYLRGLAGRAGSIAFVMPSFAQTDSAENLRAVLAKGGHVERWVDFLDNQVFPTATNYVALLFATAENPDRKTFLAQVVDKAAFESITKDPQWMDRLRPVQVAYQPGGWKIRPQPKFKGPTRPLGEVLTVEVGIQTSRDKIYLLQFVGQAPDPACVVVRNGHKEEVVLERAAMFTCAKGSRDLQGNELKNNCLVLWMFHKDGSLLRAEEIERKFPRAWAYLCKNQRDLKTREKGKFNDDRWWRFRRPQGVRCAAVPKIIVPSMMEGPAAYYDRDGSVICTASGKGGGGGWVLTPKPGLDIDLAKIAEYLRSPKHKSWLEANAEPKKGGWWGVDGNLLERCPLPVSVLR